MTSGFAAACEGGREWFTVAAPQRLHTMRLNRIALRLTCVFLLLFAQQSAFTHLAWHAGAKLQAQAQQSAADAPAHDAPDGKTGLHVAGLCDLHGAFSQVLGGVQSSAPPVLGAGNAPGVESHPPVATVVARLLAPLSRGPPARA